MSDWPRGRSDMRSVRLRSGVSLGASRRKLAALASALGEVSRGAGWETYGMVWDIP